jgi:excisionase family DNA binding protein
MQDAGRDERLTVAAAAERLGISKEAVRKRISRGSLRADKDARGTVRVYVPKSDTSSGTEVEILRELVEELRRERDDWKEQARIADRLLATALERIPELPPPAEGSRSADERESPVTFRVGPERAEPQSASGDPQEGAEPRSWWRRMFGG